MAKSFKRINLTLTLAPIDHGKTTDCRYYRYFVKRKGLAEKKNYDDIGGAPEEERYYY